MKRKVTVDSGKSAPEEGGRRKPSVFDRLGPGAARKSFGEYEDSDSDREAYVQKCRHWLLQGTCPYGSKCKFQHGPFTGGSKSKGKREDDSSDDLRLRVKGRKEKGEKNKDSDSEGSSEAKRSRSRSKKEKESRIKSAAVIVKQGGHAGSEVEVGSASHWSGEELDYKKELELEKKRQQIQKELLRLEVEEGADARENFTIQRQVASSASESDEPRRSRSTTKKSAKQSPTKKKADKKKGKQSKSPVKAKQRSPSPKAQDRYDSDSEDHHKSKHKKKGKGSGSKKHQDSFSDSGKSPEPRKLVSPLKLKVRAQPSLAKSSLFQSETEEELPPAVDKPQKRSRSYSSEEERPKAQKSRSESSKGKSKQLSASPVKRKRTERRQSPEVPASKQSVKTSGKGKHGKGKGRSVSTSRERSASPEDKKGKKMEKKKKVKKDSSEERIGKISSFEKMNTPEPYFDRDEGKVREDTPMSDYSKARDFSPGPEPVKKKKEKKKQKKMKDREVSPVKEDLDYKHRKQKDKFKERDRSETPSSRYSQKEEKRSESRSRGHKKESESKTRSPSVRGSNREPVQDRRGKSPDQPYRQQERSPLGRMKEAEGSMYGRKERDLRDRDPRGDRDFERDREREREREHEDYRRSGRAASPPERGGRALLGPAPPYRGEGVSPHAREPGPPGHRSEFDRGDPQSAQDGRRDRYPDYRDERRDRYDDRFAPNFEESRTRFERDQRGGGYERDRGHWGRPDREVMDRDRYERDKFQQQPQQSGDQRYAQEGSVRGRGRDQYDYRDSSWDRSRGRGYGNQPPRGQPGPPSGWGRGAGGERGRFEDRPNRRSEWESGRRTDEFYIPDQRRDWQDRRDDRRDMPRDESRDGRRSDRPGPDRESRRDDRDRRQDERRDDRRDDDRHEGRRSDDRPEEDRRTERDRRDGSAVRPRDIEEGGDRGGRHREMEEGSGDRRGKRDDSNEERLRDRSEERSRRGRDRNRSRDREPLEEDMSGGLEVKAGSQDDKHRSRSRDRKSRRKDEDLDVEKEKEGKQKEERMREMDNRDTDREREGRDRSRKRPSSLHDASPVPKRVRDGSPATSISSFRSNRDWEPGCRDRSRSERRKDLAVAADEEAEKAFETLSEAASEKSQSTQRHSRSQRSRSRESRSHVKQTEGQGRQSRSLERSTVADIRRCSPKSHDGRIQLEEEEEPLLASSDKKRSRSLDAYDLEEDSKRRKTDVTQETVSDGEKEELLEEKEKNEEDTASDFNDAVSPQEKTFESIEQNFSDWSDDDSDLDILNQPDQASLGSVEAREAGKEETRQRRSPSHSSLGSLHSHGSRRSRVAGQGSRPPAHTGQDRSQEKGEDAEAGGGPGEEADVDFESISSEEEELLDQQEEAKPAVVDALALDWESLAQTSKPAPASGSALVRFRAGNVFARIGVSREFAGDALYEELLSACQRPVEAGGEELEADKDAKPAEEKAETRFRFLHGVASFHAALKQKQSERKALLGNLGSFRRSLCAYRDLEIRRQLCKVDKVLDHSQVYSGQDLDTELCKESVRLFRQAADTPDSSQATVAVLPPPPTEIACP